MSRKATALVALWALVVSVAFIWIPGYWLDEGATLLMVQRPWAAFWPTVAHMDIVHCLYYLFMKPWCGIFGLSPFATRLPSAIAIAATSALLVNLGRRLISRPSGYLAGLTYPVLPASIWAAGEARSYALSAFLTTGLVLSARWAADEGARRIRWLAVTLLTMASGALFLMSTLAALAAVVAAGRRWRTALLAVGAGGIALLPFALLASGQSGQVQWIEEPSMLHWFRDVAVVQYFRDVDAAALIWLAAATAGSFLMIRSGRAMEWLSLSVWVVVPTIALGASVFLLDGQPLYVPRYLFFTAPALTLIAASSILALRPGAAPALAGLVAIAALVALPTAEDRLHEDSKSEWSAVSRTLATSMKPGDEIVAWGHSARIGSAYPIGQQIMNAIPGDAVFTTYGGPIGYVSASTRRIWLLDDGTPESSKGAAELQARGFRASWSDEALILFTR